MRTTLNLSEDALHVAKHYAMRQQLSLGDAVSALIRSGAQMQAQTHTPSATAKPRGRFALLPARDEVISIDHVRALLEREGI
jgi:predicted ATPase